MELNKKEQALNDIKEEISVVLSIKDSISEDEIQNFKEEFPNLTEKEIREQIAELTGDSSYIKDFNGQTQVLPTITDENVNVESDEIEKNNNDISANEKEINDNDANSDETGDNDKIDNLEHMETEITASDEENKEKCSSEFKKEDEKNESETEVNAEAEGNIANENEFNNAEPENITIIREEVKYNQLSLEWDWPIGINKVLVCYRNDRFPLKPEDKEAYKTIVERRADDKFGEFIINKLKEESYYFYVFPIINKDEKKYLEGKKRLIVNKPVTEIYYEIRKKKNLFGKVSSAKIILKTNGEEISIPPITILARVGNIPILKNDGYDILSSDYIKISKNLPGEIDLPLDKIGKNTYIKLFLKDEKNSELYRLIPPKMGDLYFK